MTNPNVEPLAQEFVIAARVPDPKRYFFHDPDLTRLDDGTLLMAAPQWGRTGYDRGLCLRLLRSQDGGTHWEELPTLPYEEATPFILDGNLVMFVQQKCHGDFQIVTSENAGESWTDPVTVLDGPIWNISTSRRIGKDYVYWAMDFDLPNYGHGGKIMTRFERGRSPLDPEAWSISNIVEPPELPSSLTRNLFPEGNRPQLTRGWKHKLVWLEPNTVEVNGRIRVMTRCVIDEYASAGLAAILDYEPEENILRFSQFSSWPGAQCKFFIIQDETAKMYWMLSNLVTNSQDLLGWSDRMRETGYHGGPGNERRWLFLHYSIDCLNWFPAGCVARWPDHIHRSFMYPSAVVDGEDLVILSRTSKNSGDQHDADLCTIHRVSNFRNLAMNLHGGALHGG